MKIILVLFGSGLVGILLVSLLGAVNVTQERISRNMRPGATLPPDVHERAWDATARPGAIIAVAWALAAYLAFKDETIVCTALAGFVTAMLLRVWMEPKRNDSIY